MGDSSPFEASAVVPADTLDGPPALVTVGARAGGVACIHDRMRCRLKPDVLASLRLLVPLDDERRRCRRRRRRHSSRPPMMATKAMRPSTTPSTGAIHDGVPDERDGAGVGRRVGRRVGCGESGDDAAIDGYG